MTSPRFANAPTGARELESRRAKRACRVLSSWRIVSVVMMWDSEPLTVHNRNENRASDCPLDLSGIEIVVARTLDTENDNDIGARLPSAEFRRP